MTNQAINQQVVNETERGVKNPKVIDLISHMAEDDLVQFLILEEREWEREDSKAFLSQLKQLEEKFNNYLNYILDGFFLRDYPKYQDKRISIKLVCRENPTKEAEDLILAIASFLKKTNILFEVDYTAYTSNTHA